MGVALRGVRAAARGARQRAGMGGGPARGAGGCAECQDDGMSGTTSLHPIGTAQRPVTERLWQLYSHDLSEFRGSMPGPDGLFKPGRMPGYVEEPGDPDRCGYLIFDRTDPAGFALIRGLAAEPRVMAEFFVLRAVRRRRVGYEAVRQVFRLHPGRWEIAFQEENPGAARFWRRIGADMAGGACREERRPVPGKPWIPPDTWLLLTVHGQSRAGLAPPLPARGHREAARAGPAPPLPARDPREDLIYIMSPATRSRGTSCHRVRPRRGRHERRRGPVASCPHVARTRPATWRSPRSR